MVVNNVYVYEYFTNKKVIHFSYLNRVFEVFGRVAGVRDAVAHRPGHRAIDRDGRRSTRGFDAATRTGNRPVVSPRANDGFVRLVLRRVRSGTGPKRADVAACRRHHVRRSDQRVPGLLRIRVAETLTT